MTIPSICIHLIPTAIKYWYLNVTGLVQRGINDFIHATLNLDDSE